MKIMFATNKINGARSLRVTFAAEQWCHLVNVVDYSGQKLEATRSTYWLSEKHTELFKCSAVTGKSARRLSFIGAWPSLNLSAP